MTQNGERPLKDSHYFPYSKIKIRQFLSDVTTVQEDETAVRFFVRLEICVEPFSAKTNF